MCPSSFIDPVYIYQYMLTAHLLGCAVIVALTLALGIRPSVAKEHGSHMVMLFSILYVAAQIPVTIIRLHVASQSSFVLAHPAVSYINFAWSPMATIPLLWLYMSHMVSSCMFCAMDVPKENIDAYPRLDRAIVGLATGIAAGYVIYELILPIFCLDALLVLRVLFGTAVAISLLEIIYIRTRYNKVRLFNFTWFMYIGTWFYVMVKGI